MNAALSHRLGRQDHGGTGSHGIVYRYPFSISFDNMQCHGYQRHVSSCDWAVSEMGMTS